MEHIYFYFKMFFDWNSSHRGAHFTEDSQSKLAPSLAGTLRAKDNLLKRKSLFQFESSENTNTHMDNNMRWSELCNVFLVAWAFKNTQLFACNANISSSKDAEWYHLNKHVGMNINLGSLGIIHTLTRCTDKPKENHIHDCWHSLIFFYKCECIFIFIFKTLAVFKVIVNQKRESSVPCMLHQATGCSLWTIPTPKGALQCHQICSAAKKRIYILVNLLPLMLFDPHQP